jgi:signal transduction histidine kinase
MALDAAARESGKPRAVLARARTLATAALDEARSAAEQLRPPRLEARGLASALHELALRCGLPVELELDMAAGGGLAPEQVLEVYRIAQEAVANAVRHSNSPALAMRFASTRGGVRLDIADEGIGFDPVHVAPRGFGLTGMRERATLLGGRLRITSHPGSGTRVTLVVPITQGVREGVRGQSLAQPSSPNAGRRL